MNRALRIGALVLLVTLACSRARAQDDAADLDTLLAPQGEDSGAAGRPEDGDAQGAGDGAQSQQAQAAPAPEPEATEAAAPPLLATIPVGNPEATPPPPPVEKDAPRQLEEIVVTARKREESLQDAPVVVTALSAKQIERYNISDMTKIAEMTPQLFVSSGSNGNGGTITLRGIGSSSTTSGFDQAVAINVDGIQYSRATVLHQGYFDVGQVEVLKGPQSLFFGKSSSAGVISLGTADPETTREAMLRTGYELGAREQWYEGVLSGAVSDDFSARLAARHTRMRGYIDNLAGPVTDSSNGATVPAPDPQWPQERQSMARLTLLYQPGGAFDAKLKLSWVDLANGGLSPGTELIDCSATGSAQLSPGEECIGNWQVHQNGLPADVAATEPIWNREQGRLYSIYKAYSGVATLNYQPEYFKLTSVTGYYQFDNQYIGDYDFTEASIIVGAEHPHEDTLSQELRLLSDFDFPLNFMVGGYYQRKLFEFNDNTSRLLPLPQDPVTGRYAAFVRDSETRGRAWSVFGQLLWKVTDTIDAAAGARYSDETKDSFSVHRYLHPLTAALFRPVGDPISARTHDTNVSPEVTLSWRPSGDLMLYGAWKKGFKSGGYSNSAILARTTQAADEVFRPETVAGLESGVKSSWLDNTLQLNLAAYDYKFRDLQVNFFDSANVNFLTQNAAEATTRGVELELRWLPPVDGLDVHGALAWNRAVYGKFISFCYTGQSYDDGCNLHVRTNPDGTYARDDNGNYQYDPANPPLTPGNAQHLDGTVRPLAPRFNATFGLFYEFPVWGDLMLALGSDTSYVSRYLLNPLGRQIYQDGYFRTDASIGLSPVNPSWEVSLVGRNLTNAYTIYDEGDSPLSGQGTGQRGTGVLADQVGVIGRSREIALQVTVRFGEH